jgi:NADH:ubiquinone oxidoreductase subunit K
MLERLLILSAVLFCIGLYGALSRRHLIAVLISIEIMFNAVNIAFVAVSRYVTPAALRVGGGVTGPVEPLVLVGQSFALFVIVVAAAEVALGLALVIAMVRRKDTVDISEINLMRG